MALIREFSTKKPKLTFIIKKDLEVSKFVSAEYIRHYHVPYKGIQILVYFYSY